MDRKLARDAREASRRMMTEAVWAKQQETAALARIRRVPRFANSLHAQAAALKLIIDADIIAIWNPRVAEQMRADARAIAPAYVARIELHLENAVLLGMLGFSEAA